MTTRPVDVREDRAQRSGARPRVEALVVTFGAGRFARALARRGVRGAGGEGRTRSSTDRLRRRRAGLLHGIAAGWDLRRAPPAAVAWGALKIARRTELRAFACRRRARYREGFRRGSVVNRSGMKWRALASAMIAALAVGGCAQDLGGTYARTEARRDDGAVPGTIEAVRACSSRNEDADRLGRGRGHRRYRRQHGRRRTWQAVATVIGAVAGELAGSAVEEGAAGGGRKSRASGQ